MRAASLVIVIAALISSPSMAGFCLEVAPSFGATTSVNSPNVGADQVARSVDPFANTELLATDPDIFQHRDGARDFNLASQFEQQFKVTARELRTHGFAEEHTLEGLGLQVIFFTLLVGVWLYRRRRAHKTPLSRILHALRQIQTEIKSYPHESQVFGELLRELQEFCSFSNITPVLPNSDRIERPQLVLKLVAQIALRLPRYPLRPSSYAAALQQFTILLERLQDARVIEVQYQRRPA